LAWLHVPKAGSSLVNSLTRLPNTCPGLPSDIVVDEASFGAGFMHNFSEVYPDWRQRCPGMAGFASDFGAHDCVGAGGDSFDRYDGHGVVMMRLPEERQISAWRYRGAMARFHHYHNHIKKFANHTAGCAVRMLTQDKLPPDASDGLNLTWTQVGCWGNPPSPVTQQDTTLAIERLRRFAFVGLTEEWALSVCLLHEMFGGDCHAAEFENTRSTDEATLPGIVPEAEARAAYGDFTDPYDGALYLEARSLFQASLQRYGVSEESCAASCFRAAGISADGRPVP